MELFIKGLLIGLSIAAPVGPIGLLCIKRTLSNGRLSGFTSGLGAATADGVYGLVAGFGMTFLTGFLIAHVVALKIIGGLFLLYLGIKTLISKPAEKEANVERKGIISDYVSILLLTLTNPMTILSFIGIFTGAGIVIAKGSYSEAITLVIGVFIGSALWWLILSTLTGIFRNKMTPKRLKYVNIVSGLIIIAFALSTLLGTFVNR